ncbi:amidohydrolase family protein [Chitinasiproducens palmae]|uniref:Predicted metal-dependent hydrolase, TIM-barrel fold n=1 Tax=Chitinasiproducens palmae TaxID=1770053 RepID=A0A1H2PMG7_9BURK|nr:amidohydrolase family protein [Chitinasiproducens palmae]SDV47304.1 Predicted metal-dependent hydrolase, TIM-barrel fold [Chitinasiproducens palmae]
MPSRRDSLKALAAMAAGLGSVPAWAGRPSSAAPTVKTRVNFAVPRGACDSHVHVFPDPTRFSPSRPFTPPEASGDQLLALQRALGMDHVVIVNSTVYGATIQPVLEVIGQLGQRRARGVALFDPKLGAEEIDALHAGGIRGVRVFLGLTPDVDLSAAARQLEIADKQVAGRPWHIQVYGKHSVLAALRTQLGALRAPLVFDHFCGIDAPAGLDQDGFGDVVALVRSGKAYVKLSGPYYCSDKAPDYPDMTPYAKALIGANPERVLWGSDWPHPNSTPIPTRKATDIAPAQDIDDGLVLDQLAVWAPDVTVRKQILCDNPQRLYGF